MRPLLLVVTFLFGARLLMATSLPPAVIFYIHNPLALDATEGARLWAVQHMVDDLVMTMTRQPSPAQAWASLVKPSERIGLKVSASGRSVSGTHPAVVEAIARGLLSAGIPREHILVWDRNLEDLLATGYTLKNPYYVLRWVPPIEGYDHKNRITSPVIGKLIWGDSRFGKNSMARVGDLIAEGEQLSSDSFYAKILTQEVDKIINIPSLIDSYLTGIHGALVNITLPNIDNWRRFTKEDGNAYIAEIYADEMIRSKVILTIFDGLVLQFAGGPYPDPLYTVIESKLYASFDPVAMDAIALRRIDEMRVKNRLPKCIERAKYVQVASQMGIGTAEERDIVLQRIGSTEP